MAGQPHLLCSTGAFTRDPDRTDYRAILTYGPAFAVDGFELLFYPDWYPGIEGIATGLRASSLRFPVLHAEKSISPALGSDQPEVRALGLQRLRENCRLGGMLGATLLILHLWGLPGSDEHLDRNLDALTACLGIAADEGLTVAVETIPCVRADPLSNVRRALDRDARCLAALDTEFLAFQLAVQRLPHVAHSVAIRLLSGAHGHLLRGEILLMSSFPAQCYGSCHQPQSGVRWGTAP